MLIFQNLAALKAAANQDLAATDWLTVTQEMIDNFAKSTLDFQWIHTDLARAKASPFGSTIAHGFLTLSLVSHFVEQLFKVESAQMVVNYGLNKVRFPSVVPSGARVRMKGHFKSVDEYGDNGVSITLSVVIELENQTKPACVLEWVIVMFE
jgi:acyl dehydratase